MSAGTFVPVHCSHCGRPIANEAVYLGGYAYHPECTRGPSYPATFQHLPPNPPPTHHLWHMPVAPPRLTEEDVRRIVREELTRRGDTNG